ncbi:MAG: adenosylcobalamin-dependent ribonucleoside-diphosphate reductase [Patescibacteria group bacterium]|jgi:ribonucleoside-diphosphate reductase alpha chain
MKITEPNLTKSAKKIAEKRYLRTDMEGNVIETPGEMFWRVAQHLAKAEINWGMNGIVEKTAKQFFERMVNLKFVVAGKALFEAGNPGGTGQLSSCFVLPVEDNIHSIFKTLGDAAVVHKNNGGTGFNFSKIRPRGDKVKNVPGAASGPVDFLSAYSAALSKILQGSKRQGANIGVLNVDHPDIIDFITLKEEDGTIKNFNVSVGVTNEFMEAVEQDKPWELINPRNGEVVKKIKARKLFDLIVEHAWATGDPGLAFLDRMQEDNPTPSLGVINCTNPCGEIPLLPYESCNLTSIILSNHIVKDKNGSYEIDWDDLEKSIKVAVRLLDDMIEVNNYPLKEIEEMVKNGNRRIGLGVMGFAHLLFKLGIPYNSEEAIRLSERLAKFIRRKAEEMSLELGKERGVFPNWDRSIYAGSAERYRNCALTMIAPTGTISMLANCSSGIEPVFSLVTLRKTFFEDDKKNRPTEELMMIDPEFEEYLKTKGLTKKEVRSVLETIAAEGNLGSVEHLNKKEKKLFVTSHQIEPEWHVRIQAAWQKHFDNSVSKTINFPHNATAEDVRNAYMLAWRLGCKGITIYRDGSKQDQVLNVKSTKYEVPSTKLDTNSDLIEKVSKTENLSTQNSALSTSSCPECGARIVKSEGCATCHECGWSQCKL